MKRGFLLVTLILLHTISFAQTNVFPLISIEEGSSAIGSFGRGLAITGAWNQNPDALALTYSKRDFVIGGWSKSDATWMGASFYINSDNGNTGIGTTTPQFKLQVQKTSAQPAIMISGSYSGSPRLQVYGLDADPNAWMGLGADMAGGPYEHSIYFPSGVPSNKGKLTIGDYDGTTYSTKMTILQNGNIGIGSSSPSEKLVINGKVRAHEIKVEATNWPDYVFTKSYPLPSLQETEKHIKEKGHLPGIPSAAEVKANGIDLGEMNENLLKKIEELTLHLIEQNKTIESYNKRFADQDEKLKQQAADIECLKLKKN